MLILDKRGWKEKDFWERAYEETERKSECVFRKSCQGCRNVPHVREFQLWMFLKEEKVVTSRDHFAILVHTSFCNRRK
jgi:hypothetical protein